MKINIVKGYLNDILVLDKFMYKLLVVEIYMILLLWYNLFFEYLMRKLCSFCYIYFVFNVFKK